MAPSSPQISFELKDISDGKLLAVKGDIDFGSSAKLRQNLLQLLEAHPKRLVLDLTLVAYMDSSGLATLIEALQHQRQTRGKMVLCGVQPRVLSVFQIARLDMLFTIAQDIDAALTS